MTGLFADLATDEFWAARDASQSAGLSDSMAQWEHEPVSLTEFVTGRDYLANPRLSLVQYEAVRYAERIFYDHTYSWLAGNCAEPENRAYWAEPVRMVNFVTLEWGKGGGKDHICRIISLRCTYLLLCLRYPLDYFTMPDQDTIHLLNVASSAPQANRAFFTPMRRAVIRQNGWFARHDYAHPLKGTIEYAKNIEAISGHSDAETQEGLNILVGVADEIDAFKTLAELERQLGAQARESSRSAEGVLKMLRSSARTRFPETFKNVRISWPRYLGSMIQQLVDQGNDRIEAEPETARHYVSGPWCTWEVNPRVTGREYFQDDYDEDPFGSMARYECKPRRAINPFFSNPKIIEAAEREVTRQPVVVTYERDGNAWKAAYDISAELVPIVGAQYAMHADLAVKNDRAGLAMAHVERYEQATVTGYTEQGLEVELSEARPVVKVDFVISFEADQSKEPAIEIQIRWARMLCLELRRRGFAIRRFTFDGYQSTDSMQILEAHGIESERVSTDLTDEHWRNIRDLASEARVSWPKRPLLRNELLALSKLPNGKVDHPAGGSKDEADALACAITGAILLGGSEGEEPKQAFPSMAELEELPQPLPLPIDFRDPRLLRFGSEVNRNPVVLDGMGRPLPAYDDLNEAIW